MKQVMFPQPPGAPNRLASPVLGKRGPYETGAGRNPLLGSCSTSVHRRDGCWVEGRGWNASPSLSPWCP